MPVGPERRTAMLARLHKIAGGHGGRVVSRAYVNNQTPLEFECSAGHRWESRPPRVLSGGWCRRCDGHVRRSLADCAGWAAEKGGVCLSETYVHANYPLRWRCADDHEWTARPNSIKQGSWCPRCAGRGPRSSDELQRLARRFRGACLTTSYTDPAARLRWRCRHGHEFERTLADVRRGRWCRRCAGRTPWTLADLQRLAETRGGACLARSYANAQTPMRWRCAAGHTWSTSAGHVVRGSWCARCHVATRTHNRRLTLDDMHATAAEHGGACLAASYRGSAVKLRWRCAAGHTWMAAPTYVRAGHWCVRCNAAARG